jgi:hypothetical protein
MVALIPHDFALLCHHNGQRINDSYNGNEVHLRSFTHAFYSRSVPSFVIIKTKNA